ncbi:MAG: HEAT repeat domain-containing protein [Elusimicrobia bacterium]|nr:HEAT repeat domain-containing protein [Elusimicrobiota bacterium]
MRHARPIILAAAAACACAGPGAKGMPSDRLAAGLSEVPAAERFLRIDALGARGGKAAVAVLAARLDPKLPDPAEAGALVRALGRTGRTEAVEPLLSLWETLLARKFRLFSLPPELESLRADIAGALGLLADIKSVPALRRGLIDDDRRVAAASAGALAALGDAGSRAPLVRLAEGPDADASQAAFEALGRRGGSEAEAALRRGLEAEDTLRRPAAAYGLALMGRVAGTLRLEGFLEESLEPTREGVLAAHYLGRLGRDDGMRWLAAAAASAPSDKRLLAIDALGKAGREEGAEPLAAAAGDADPAVRTLAALALGRLPGRRAADALRGLASDADAGVRAAARRGLAAQGVSE